MAWSDGRVAFLVSACVCRSKPPHVVSYALSSPLSRGRQKQVLRIAVATAASTDGASVSPSQDAEKWYVVGVVFIAIVFVEARRAVETGLKETFLFNAERAALASKWLCQWLTTAAAAAAAAATVATTSPADVALDTRRHVDGKRKQPRNRKPVPETPFHPRAGQPIYGGDRRTRQMR